MTRKRTCDTCGHPEHDGMQLVMQGWCHGCESCAADDAEQGETETESELRAAWGDR